MNVKGNQGTGGPRCPARPRGPRDRAWRASACGSRGAPRVPGRVRRAAGSRRYTRSLSPYSAPAAACARRGAGRREPRRAWSSRLGRARGFHVLTAPIVGTFTGRRIPTRSRSSRSATSSRRAKTLCIIEAMKLMNEIRRTWRGRSWRSTRRTRSRSSSAKTLRDPAPLRRRVPEGTRRQTVERSRSASSPPARSWGLRRWPSTRRPTVTRSTSGPRTSPCASGAGAVRLIPEHHVARRGGRDHGRRRRAPGLRLPRRERALRRDPRGRSA